MEHLTQIALLIAALASGYAAARLSSKALPDRAKRAFASIVDLSAKVALYLLLATMGFRLGNDREVGEKLASIGAMGLFIAVATLALTFASVGIGCYLLLGKARSTESGSTRREGNARSFLAGLKDPLWMLGTVLSGVAAGAIAAAWIRVDESVVGSVTEWLLMALLLLIGMQFALSNISLKASFLRPEILLVPLLTAIGSISAGFLVAPLFSIPLGKALAACAGFGWYSLSGVIIGNLGDSALGSAAFLGNIMRESMAIALIPFLARLGAHRLAIGAGGATAMDVTLPVIERAFGPEYVPESFVSGAILSLLVPVLVPFLYALG
jgi:uncharacterized membrane protein YbjE (DUF340 family)